MSDGFTGVVLDQLGLALGGSDATVMVLLSLILIVLFIILGPEYAFFMLPFVMIIVGWAYVPAAWAYLVIVVGLFMLASIFAYYFFGIRMKMY